MMRVDRVAEHLVPYLEASDTQPQSRGGLMQRITFAQPS
jgi:hypothetical protein